MLGFKFVFAASVFAIGMGFPSMVAAQTKNSDNQKHVNTSDKTTRIISSALFPKLWLSTQSGRPPAANTQTAKDGNAFIFVELETEFPKADGWDLSVFFLQDQSAERNVFLAFAFTAGSPTEDPEYTVFYRAETGAAAIILDDKVKMIGNPLGKPGQIVFAFGKNSKGEILQWPGGKAVATLAFEVPVASSKFELLKPNGVTAERLKLEGSWLLDSVESNGTKETPKDGDTNVLTIKGTNYVEKREGTQKLTLTGSIEIDATRNPKTMKTYLHWIYEIEGDTLRMCSVSRTGDAAKDFSATSENGQMLLVYKREKTALGNGSPQDRSSHRKTPEQTSPKK